MRRGQALRKCWEELAYSSLLDAETVQAAGDCFMTIWADIPLGKRSDVLEFLQNQSLFNEDHAAVSSNFALFMLRGKRFEHGEAEVLRCLLMEVFGSVDMTDAHMPYNSDEFERLREELDGLVSTATEADLTAYGELTRVFAHLSPRWSTETMPLLKLILTALSRWPTAVPVSAANKYMATFLRHVMFREPLLFMQVVGEMTPQQREGVLEDQSNQVFGSRDCKWLAQWLDRRSIHTVAQTKGWLHFVERHCTQPCNRNPALPVLRYHLSDRAHEYLIEYIAASRDSNVVRHFVLPPFGRVLNFLFGSHRAVEKQVERVLQLINARPDVLEQMKHPLLHRGQATMRDAFSTRRSCMRDGSASVWRKWTSFLDYVVFRCEFDATLLEKFVAQADVSEYSDMLLALALCCCTKGAVVHHEHFDEPFRGLRADLEAARQKFVAPVGDFFAATPCNSVKQQTIRDTIHDFLGDTTWFVDMYCAGRIDEIIASVQNARSPSADDDVSD
ncbi:MAG: hypothetical protein MHM6MM_004039 [Cercozoa sp. M6MM]